MVRIRVSLEWERTFIEYCDLLQLRELLRRAVLSLIGLPVRPALDDLHQRLDLISEQLGLYQDKLRFLRGIHTGLLRVLAD